MITPYFIKSKNPYLTFCLAIKPVNIIPAKAPIGVKNAPIFEPIIEAYTAWVVSKGVGIFGITLKSTLIGILFIKLQAKNEEKP